MTLHSLTDEVMSTACRESFHLPSNGFLLFKYIFGFKTVVHKVLVFFALQFKCNKPLGYDNTFFFIYFLIII